MIPVALVAAALAGEHDAPELGAISVTGANIPPGPPVDARATPGDDIQALITSLPAGSRLVLGAGTHAGPLILDRPLELSGEAGAVIDAKGAGTVLIVGAPDTVVRDLRLTGGGHLSQNDDSGLVLGADRFLVERVIVDDVYLGIDMRMASHGTVRDCVISGEAGAPFGKRGDGMRLWESHHNTIENNRIAHVRDLVVWYADHNRIVGNTVSDSRYGTHLMHTTGNTIDGNTYRDDVVGVFTMYSADVIVRGNTVTGAKGEAGVGLGFKESDRISVVDNALVGNTSGLYLDTTPHEMVGVVEFRGNLIAANEVGLRFHGPQYGGVFTDNAFVANREPVSGVALSESAASFVGNLWSDYAGYDLDADGSGDLPYAPRTLARSWFDREQDLEFFVGTPAVALIDLFAAAFPMFAPTSGLVDPSPAMTWEAE